MKVFVKSISQRDNDVVEVNLIIYPYKHREEADRKQYTENDKQWLERENLQLGQAELTQER